MCFFVVNTYTATAAILKNQVLLIVFIIAALCSFIIACSWNYVNFESRGHMHIMY